MGYGPEDASPGARTVAALTIGYADGLPRALSNGRGRVLLNGRSAPIRGRICMDQTIVDVTDIPDVRPGQEAVLLGRSGREEITAYDIAEVIGLIHDFSEWRMANAPKPPIWRDTVQGAQVVITKVKAGEAFEHGQLSTPIDAWMEIVIQSYPGEEQEELLDQLDKQVRQRYHDPEGLSIELEYHYIKPAATPADHLGVTALARCATPYTDRAVICGGMLSCDMFELTDLGHIPCVVFGPVGERRHAPDEWVDLDSMEVCIRILMDFIREWCG